MRWTVIELKDGQAKPLAATATEPLVGSLLRVQGTEYKVVLIENSRGSNFIYVHERAKAA
jgi:hypothetical protein